MKTVTSRDGTTIAYDQYGTGAPVILVGGALQTRGGDTPQLATALASDFTVLHYDRRGRGDSGDTQPFAIDREIEDIEALIDAVGGSAYLFGNSSGGALVMKAALKLGGKVKKIAIYEVPYNSEDSARQAWMTYRHELKERLDANRRGDAVALFMKYVGTPDEAIEGMRHAPFFQALEAIAPTLGYDHLDLLGDDASVPTEYATSIAVPALFVNGDSSYPFMQVTAEALTNTVPQAQHRVLKGQTHAADPQMLAAVLKEFFAA
jgi:pimeloyl-ACP methyl ester carboxylesterase